MLISVKRKNILHHVYKINKEDKHIINENPSPHIEKKKVTPIQCVRTYNTQNAIDTKPNV